MADFVVKQWSVWPSSMEGHVVSSADPAPLSAKLPKMLQRRLTPLARAAFYVAEACLEDDQALPIVFSSAHGEINQSLAMLKSLQQTEAVSPTAFSLSVHNALSGLFSMAHGNHQAMSVIAPGQDGIAPAFIEALGLLHEFYRESREANTLNRPLPLGEGRGEGTVRRPRHDGYDEVLMVFYDEPLPNFYPTHPFKFNMQTTLALALRISLAGSGLQLSFDRSSVAQSEAEHALQISLFWKFMVSDDSSLMLGNHRSGFEWRKK